MAAAAAAEMQALQAYKDMMTRAAMGGSSLPPVSSSSAAANNPYAALYAGLMGYPASAFTGRKDL